MTGGTEMLLTVTKRATANSNSSAVNPAAAYRPSRMAALLRAVRGLGWCSNGELRFQLEKVLLTEAAHVHELLNFLERAVLLPIFDDARRHLGPDAGQRLEVGCRCGIDVHDLSRPRLCRRLRFGLSSDARNGGKQRRKRSKHHG